jgi:hypothetical protein
MTWAGGGVDVATGRARHSRRRAHYVYPHVIFLRISSAPMGHERFLQRQAVRELHAMDTPVIIIFRVTPDDNMIENDLHSIKTQCYNIL